MLQNRFTGLFLLFDLGVGRTTDLNTGIQLRLPPLLSKKLNLDRCSSEEETPRRSNKWIATLSNRRGREVRYLLQVMFDLPALRRF